MKSYQREIRKAKSEKANRNHINDKGFSDKDNKTVINKSDIGKIECKIESSESINAPVKIGDRIGRISYYLAGNEIGSADVLSKQNVDAISFWTLMVKFIASMTLF